MPLGDAIARVEEVPGLSAKAVEAVSGFVALLDGLRKNAGRRKIGTIARKLVESTGIEPVLLASSDSPHVASRRIENVREIVRAD